MDSGGLTPPQIQKFFTTQLQENVLNSTVPDKFRRTHSAAESKKPYTTQPSYQNLKLLKNHKFSVAGRHAETNNIGV